MARGQKERKAERTGKAIEEPLFTADQDSLRWSRFKETAPEQMFETMRDRVFPFIKTLGQKGDADGEGGSTYTHHMKDALFMMPTARVLANVAPGAGIVRARRDSPQQIHAPGSGSVTVPGLRVGYLSLGASRRGLSPPPMSDARK